MRGKNSLFFPLKKNKKPLFFRIRPAPAALSLEPRRALQQLRPPGHPPRPPGPLIIRFVTKKNGERERRRKGADEGETKELTFSLFALSTFQNPKTPFLSTGLHPGLRRLPLRLPAPLPQPRRSRIHGRGGQGHGSRVRGRRRPQRRGRGL